MTSYFADQAWLPQGWASRVRFDVDARDFQRVEAEVDADAAQRVGRYVMPGMPNLHSHAFQRAMAGLAERQSDANDSFWTWREIMYAFASRIGPDELRAIAAQLYVEMLKAGYTQVCEFHYLHHQPDGMPYADSAAMSLALIEAAREAGIGLTLLPTLYMTGGFDGRPLSERQRRFGHTVDAYLRLVERLRAFEGGGVARRHRVAFACARCPRMRCGPCCRRVSSTPRRSTFTSPNRSAKCRTASRCATRARSTGCSITRPSTHAGASCTRRI